MAGAFLGVLAGCMGYLMTILMLDGYKVALLLPKALLLLGMLTLSALVSLVDLAACGAAAAVTPQLLLMINVSLDKNRGQGTSEQN